MDPKCPECEKAGLVSTVEMHTAMGEPPVKPVMDEEGRLHFHDESPVSAHWGCSNKHSWREESVCSCPVEGCDWEPSN